MNDKTIVIFPTDIKTIDISNYDKLQSNWNSLREWLEEQIKDTVKFKNALGYSHEDKHFQKMLDKMNELEGEDK